MLDRYIPGVAVPKYDASVSDALEDAAQGDGDGKTMVLAVENTAGEVYRVFETLGLGEFLAATEEMELMDFTNVLTHSQASSEGYDVRFRPPGDI